MKDVSSATSSNAIGRRRAIIAGGSIVAAGLLVAEAPLAVKYGRRQLAIELAKLEGIAIDAASEAADATFAAVDLIVMPIADALAGISAESLDNLLIAVQALKAIGVDQDVIDNLSKLLTEWKGNVALFPATVQALEHTERDAGKKYLASLKEKRIQEAANS